MQKFGVLALSWVIAVGAAACSDDGISNDVSPDLPDAGATLCGADERVVGNACAACAAGTTNEAGDDASGEDTECGATLCAADEHVVANACVTCAAGTTNEAGEDASGGDTECDATLCDADEHVVEHACVACPAGSTNEADDDASGEDTDCDPTLCAAGHHVVSHACVACEPGEGRDAGDDASGEDTECAPAYTMFATSSTHTGDLGGLAGADAICQGEANDAGLAGTYVALLSTGAVDAVSRIANPTYAIRRADGVLLAADRAAFFGGGLANGPGLDASGATVSTSGFAGNVMTGSNDDGTLVGVRTCSDWTAADALAPYVSDLDHYDAAGWFSIGVSACSVLQRIYCIGR